MYPGLVEEAIMCVYISNTYWITELRLLDCFSIKKKWKTHNPQKVTKVRFWYVEERQMQQEKICNFYLFFQLVWNIPEKELKRNFNILNVFVCFLYLYTKRPFLNKNVHRVDRVTQKNLLAFLLYWHWTVSDKYKLNIFSKIT